MIAWLLEAFLSSFRNSYKVTGNSSSELSLDLENDPSGLFLLSKLKIFRLGGILIGPSCKSKSDFYLPNRL